MQLLRYIHFKTIIIAVITVSNFQGCSRLEFQTRYEQQAPFTWKSIRDTLDPYFEYECQLESSSLRTRSYRKSAWGLFGLPIIPFFPYWLKGEAVYPLHYNEKFVFLIEEIRRDTLKNADSLQISLIVNPGGYKVYPLECNRRGWWNNKNYHRYVFDVNIDTMEAFVVNFDTTNIGSKIPTLTYSEKSESYYTPLRVPVH